MEELKRIKKEYFKEKEIPDNSKDLLKQNLQAEINKIEGIIRKLSEKKAPEGELNRLRTYVMKLLSVIDNNDQLHL